MTELSFKVRDGISSQAKAEKVCIFTTIKAAAGEKCKTTGQVDPFLFRLPVGVGMSGNSVLYKYLSV